MTCLGLLLFALFAPSAAMAENCNAPPGTSGIDQYCESLPSPGGSGGGSHHGGGGNGGGGNKLHHVNPTTTKTLQNSGAAGHAVLDLTQQSDAPAVTTSAQTTTPAPVKKHLARKHHTATTQSNDTPATTTPQRVNPGPSSSAPASNPAAAVGNSFGGSAGAGFLALLAAITAVFAGLAWRGRRRPEPRPR
jgi:hypothetical protein